MKRFAICLLSVATACFALGCNNHHSSTVESEKQRWRQEGWKYLETFGTPADDGVYAAHFSSATARSITAFASADGIVTDHVYEQTGALYLIVTMQRPTGGTFALIFDKSKP